MNIFEMCSFICYHELYSSLFLLFAFWWPIHPSNEAVLFSWRGRRQGKNGIIVHKFQQLFVKKNKKKETFFTNMRDMRFWILEINWNKKNISIIFCEIKLHLLKDQRHSLTKAHHLRRSSRKKRNASAGDLFYSFLENRSFEEKKLSFSFSKVTFDYEDILPLLRNHCKIQRFSSLLNSPFIFSSSDAFSGSL